MVSLRGVPVCASPWDPKGKPPLQLLPDLLTFILGVSVSGLQEHAVPVEARKDVRSPEPE